MIVSDEPGDPNKEVDPVPKINVDLKPPHLNGVKLHSNEFGRKGTTLRWGTNEKSKLDASTTRSATGTAASSPAGTDWKGHVGYDDATFGGKSKHFDAKPGRYMAIVRASDTSNNTSKKRDCRFKVG